MILSFLNNNDIHISYALVSGVLYKQKQANKNNNKMVMNNQLTLPTGGVVQWSGVYWLPVTYETLGLDSQAPQ